MRRRERGGHERCNQRVDLLVEPVDAQDVIADALVDPQLTVIRRVARPEQRVSPQQRVRHEGLPGPQAAAEHGERQLRGRALPSQVVLEVAVQTLEARVELGRETENEHTAFERGERELRGEHLQRRRPRGGPGAPERNLRRRVGPGCQQYVRLRLAHDERAVLTQRIAAPAGARIVHEPGESLSQGFELIVQEGLVGGCPIAHVTV